MKKKKNDIFDTPLLRRVLSLVKPVRKEFIFAIVLTLTLSLLVVLKPYFVQKIIDDGIFSSNAAVLKQFVLVFAALIVAEAIVRYMFIYLTAWIGQTIIKDLRIKVFKHVNRLKMRFFDKTPIGTVTTRTINDVEAVNRVFSEGFITIFSELFTMIVILAFMLHMDWKLTLICLLTFPIFLYASYQFKEGIKKTYQDIREQVSVMNSFLQEHISGMSIVQYFSAEEKEYEQFKNINNDYLKANIHTVWYYSIFFPVVEIIQASALGLLIWFGSKQVIHHEATIGVLMAFILYLNQLFRPMRLIADRFNTLQMGLVAAERVFHILDNDEIIENKGTHLGNDIQGAIEFKNVTFAYDGVNEVLKDVSFKANAGETIAIVGPTGAGKSSIINILNRQYSIQKGEVLVDNISIKDYELESLRDRIAIVLQDVMLFSGTIRSNIKMYSDITDAEIERAVSTIEVEDFINNLPHGYESEVLERGQSLSQGQKQIIAFIRALVHQPSILVLDEATANIDTETEQLIQTAIPKLLKNRTSIVIAHRLSTIKDADRILVMKNGRIEEQGNFNELLANNGLFKELHNMQFQKIHADIVA